MVSHGHLQALRQVRLRKSLINDGELLHLLGIQHLLATHLQGLIVGDSFNRVLIFSEDFELFPSAVITDPSVVIDISSLASLVDGLLQ